MSGWIGVDLDGTLAWYDGYRTDGNIGRPVPAMVLRVRNWLRDGKKVKIFTSRVSHGSPEEVARTVDRIKLWCQVNIGKELEVTCCKDKDMIELWDDRAVQVIRNTGQPVTIAKRAPRLDDDVIPPPAPRRPAIEPLDE